MFSYPPNYINSQFTKFLVKNCVSFMSCLSELSLIDNERDFFTMRTTLFDRADRSQSKIVNMAMIKLDVNNNQLVEKAREVSVKRKTVAQNNKKDEKAVENRLILHYTQEKRFESYKRDLHRRESK